MVTFRSPCGATTEGAEIYGRSRRAIQPETKPSKPQNHAADYTRFSPLALGKWKSGKVEEWKSSATHFSTIQLFYYSTRAKRVGRAFGLKEHSGTASVGLVLHFNAEFRGIGERGEFLRCKAVIVARCLSSRAFRNTLSTPSAADSGESSPIVTERAIGSHLSRRGRRFAESDAFFGGAGSDWAEKFRLLL